MLNFTASISSSSICKDHSQVKIQITLKKPLPLPLCLPEFQLGFAFKRTWPSLGFGSLLTVLELAKDVGSFSDKFHLFLYKQTADGTRFNTRYGIRVLVTHR